MYLSETHLLSLVVFPDLCLEASFNFSQADLLSNLAFIFNKKSSKDKAGHIPGHTGHQCLWESHLGILEISLRNDYYKKSKLEGRVFSWLYQMHD